MKQKVECKDGRGGRIKDGGEKRREMLTRREEGKGRNENRKIR